MATSQQDRALIGQLLRRSGFGASGAEIDAAATLGFQGVLEGLFAQGADPGATATAPPNLTEPGYGQSGPAQKKAANAERARAAYDLIAWWIARMTEARRPWTEKRTFFWHGHFATSVQKVRSATLMLGQNQAMRALGGGDFRTLMAAMLTDPAMMIWLDAAGSTAKAPNENLARESMELFSLGVGNYTEQDVRQAALALTGWRLDRVAGRVVFTPKAHAPGPQTILGRSASFDVDSFVDLLMAQPANARFIASRMWFRLASSDPIPADTLARLTAAYGPARDLTALARAVFADPGFAAQNALTTAATQARITFAQWAVSAGDVSQVADAAPAARIDAAAHLLGIDVFSDRTRSALADVAADPAALVECALLSPEYAVN